MIPVRHPSPRAYVLTWVGLLCLTGFSFVTGLLELGLAAETGVMLTIATVKATWVALVFMHLIESRFANRVTLTTAVAFVAVLCALMVADVATRRTFPPRALPPSAAAR